MKDTNTLPDFEALKPAEIEPALDALLMENRAELLMLLDDPSPNTWTSLIDPVEAMDIKLHKFWAPIGHLQAVCNTPEWRKVYNACLPKITEYYTEIGQNESLYAAYQSVVESDAFEGLSLPQKTLLKHALRDFRLSGVHLEKPEKLKFAELQQRLSQLTTKFSENLLDASNAWSLSIKEKETLKGLPSLALESAKQLAKKKNKKGYLLTLDASSYLAVMQYAEDRPLREKMYRAYVTRASDQGENLSKWNNDKVMVEILEARSEFSQLLGYANYAEYSLVPKMASNAAEVFELLNELGKESSGIAKQEYENLQAYAKGEGLVSLESWDIAFYSEKLRQRDYDINQEQLRPYFPVPQVLKGLFQLVERLYGIQLKEKKGVSVWHPDVQFFEITDKKGKLCGQFYIDLYARENKRDGAWMDDCQSRHRFENGDMAYPVAYLVCNFNPPLQGKPGLLTHEDVITLFHEFGHSLHHMLTKVDYAAVSGTNGVPWDAVELPSQFMENFCWEKEVIENLSSHYETGEKLSDELFDRMVSAKNFLSAMQMARQLEFSFFDFRLHSQSPPSSAKAIQAVINQVRDEVAVVKPPAFNRFQNSFSHIFAGGYAAGYYSYKWAEVLSSDVYAKFEEEGILNTKVGLSFLHEILEKGGSDDPMKMFIAFRGRKPSTEALLRHHGMK
jgi:oligopeptidase A